VSVGSKQRFGIDNLATADNMTASSQGAGTVAGAKKTGSGSATLTPSGDYTGANNKLITVQIDSAGTGEIGSSTFRWKTSDTAAGSWEATGVSTSTSVLSLGSEGIKIQFTGGTGADFSLNDLWRFPVYAVYGVGNLVRNDRNTYWKGADSTTSVNIVVDLGSATQVTMFVLADHNLTSGATLTLEANATDSWGSPSYTNTVSTISEPIVEYLDETYRYFRIVIADAANPDSLISIGKLFVGEYEEVSAGELVGGANFGTGRNQRRAQVRNVADSGQVRSRLYSVREEFNLEYTWLTTAELATLQTVWQASNDVDTGQRKSLWVHYWIDDDTSCLLCESTNDFEPTYKRGGNDITLAFRQEVMTRTV